MDGLDVRQVHAPLPGPGGHPCPASLGTQMQASLVASATHIPFFEGGRGKYKLKKL